MNNLQVSMRSDRVETLEIIPRYYGPRIGDTFVLPSSFMLAKVFNTPPTKLEMILSSYFKKKVSPDTVKKKILNGIEKKYKSLRLWEESNVVLNGYVGLKRMTASVKTRTGEPDTVKVVTQPMASPIGEKGGLGFIPSGSHCTCDEFSWTKAKNRIIICVHIAAAILQAYEEFPGKEDGRIKFDEEMRKKNKLIFNPYKFSDETIVQALIMYFDGKAKLYDIDKWLLDDKNNYEQAFINQLYNTPVNFEVIPEKNKTVKKSKDVENRIHAQKCVLEAIKEELKASKFNFKGYSIEFKTSQELTREWETIALDYQKDDEVVKIVCSEKFPSPILVYKILEKEEKVLFYKPVEIKHPYNCIGKWFDGVDDMRRVKCRSIVRLPDDPEVIPPINIPKTLKELYEKEKLSAHRI